MTITKGYHTEAIEEKIEEMKGETKEKKKGIGVLESDGGRRM
jgi:hypothetical protein